MRGKLSRFKSLLGMPARTMELRVHTNSYNEQKLNLESKERLKDEFGDVSTKTGGGFSPPPLYAMPAGFEFGWVDPPGLLRLAS